jgi:hypothetical protein
MDHLTAALDYADTTFMELLDQATNIESSYSKMLIGRFA